jgi:hypothetical protein
MALSLVAFGAFAAAQQAQAAARSPAGAQRPAASGAPCVRDATVTGTTSVGQARSASGATVYRLSLRGSLINQYVSGPAWSPLTASATELRAHGFPTRPSSAAALASWEQAARSYRQAAPVGMCETDRHNGLTHTASSNNWAGGMTINGTTSTNTYDDATVRWTEPTFVSGCGTSGYSIWSGLGGWNSNNGLQRLTQTGTDVSSGLNSVYVWWEMLTSAVGNPEVAFTGSSIAAGHSVYSDTDYAGGTAYFFVEDETSGTYWSTSLSSYNGHAASYYYDGSTADAISEAPSNSSGIENLRKTTGTSIPYFTANGQALSHWRSWRINQVRSATVQSSSFDGVHGWTDSWKRCS